MEYILVLDFGGSESQAVARQVRDCNVYCEIAPFDTEVSSIRRSNLKGVILAGVPITEIDWTTTARSIRELAESGVSVLAIGDQFQELLGAKPEPSQGETRYLEQGTVLQNFGAGEVTWMSKTNKTALRNFLIQTCGCSQSWTMEAFARFSVDRIRQQVGSGRAICGLSGGIDSSVAAVLMQRAIGDRLTCIYVDHGFMRKGETEQVLNTFRKGYDINLIHVDARERFLSKLRGVSDPEEKRKIIGHEFVRVFEEEARKIGDAKYLVQGTLYTDVIESGTEQAEVIKSHHNVGGLPEDLDFELVEPLRQLFKDEVRQLAIELGLPEEIAWRHPFPGPGLAIRVIGEVTQEKLDLLREADAIAMEEIRRAGLYRKIWQAFVVLTDTKTVGKRDDARTYEYAAAIRAVNSSDGMTAQWVPMPYDVLDRISSRIMEEVPGINRVVYDISSKPPATIEWE